MALWNGDLYNNIREAYEWDLDDYLTEEEFIQKIKDDELFAEHGENSATIRTTMEELEWY